MLKKVISVVMLTLLLVGMFSLAINIKPAKSTWTGTVYIRADGSIDPSDAPIITYDNITYTLIDNITSSEDGIIVERDDIIIDGAGYTLQGTGEYPYKGVDLSYKSNVTIKNITITKFYYGIVLYYSSNNSIIGCSITANNRYGIWLHHSSNDSISGNKITANNEDGIYLEDSSNVVISENNIVNNGGSGGLHLHGCSNIIISENNIVNNDFGVFLHSSSNNLISGNYIDNRNDGLHLYGSSNNVISGNNIKYNAYHGILLQCSPNNVFRNNSIVSNHYSFAVYGSLLSHFIQDVDISNTVNGKPVYYLINQKNLIINSSTYPNIGYLALVNSTNVTVEGLELKNMGQGILFAYTKNSTITKNNITDSYGGIHLHGCSNIVVSENYIAYNNYYGHEYGIGLGNSSSNVIFGNSIVNNRYGIKLSSSSNNIIAENSIVNNHYGITLSHSSNNCISGNNVTDTRHDGIELYNSTNNKFYHNNFINNTRHVHDFAWDYPERFSPSVNFWDNGYPSGGNYWNDYKGTDADGDGIGDTPYVIDDNNIDRYPLMGSFNTFDAGIWNGQECNVDVVSNSTVSNFQLNTTLKTISFNVTGVDETAGFCRITIPNIIVEDLWHGNYTVLLNGEPWPFRNWTDNENTYIYVNYTHSTHQITIVIPELPTAKILPLFMLLSVIAIILAKKKRLKKQKPKPLFSSQNKQAFTRKIL